MLSVYAFCRKDSHRTFVVPHNLTCRVLSHWPWHLFQRYYITWHAEFFLTPPHTFSALLALRNVTSSSFPLPYTPVSTWKARLTALSILEIIRTMHISNAQWLYDTRRTINSYIIILHQLPQTARLLFQHTSTVSMFTCTHLAYKLPTFSRNFPLKFTSA